MRALGPLFLITRWASSPTQGTDLDAGEGGEPPAWALLEQANLAGGVDNTTVVVIDVMP